MGDHKRFFIILQMIRLLSRPGGFAVKRLAQRFDVTPRSIYRYFDLLRECGFALEKSGGRYRFQNSGDAEKNMLGFGCGGRMRGIRIRSKNRKKTRI
ncbi:MAG: HTH domain-containing protein [Balneolaceae bacterium]